MKETIIAFATATSLFAGSALIGAEYNVDNAHSSIGFKIKHMQVSNVKGFFTDHTSIIDFDENKKYPNKIESIIKVASVNTGIEKRDNHLRTADFFDAQKFPEMKFVMKEFIPGDESEGKIKGDMTVKGVTKPITLNYDFGGITKNKDGKNMIGFSLDGEIKRSDFGVGEQSVMVGDKVNINIEIEAVEK
ncbi:polyisoprenoid-binding protein [Campylobacter sp. RM12327]|uniref:YceI family protein n=1 Tax=Campylobacter sputorum TaxID=206 RepID=UPI000B78B55F|nr:MULTISPECIES: YceI family protein [Campylobacter]ASM39896.1 putative periplasmic protein (YceI-like domain) [Campylobacter sputorum]MBE7357547.1 polyisoprenoid-binding protein [Campylobacter sp. RM11302]MBF6669152.1 polyisoprenoid-binding protein [Campylobacter sp. RM12327]MBF6674372.1 polyisoprenoid-binding protein [Campylobacter sp. RM13538]MBF6675413.1 polyisoprenoid-binding protein [Campylobacter sp. RM12321]